jgi:hypothetical protein
VRLPEFMAMDSLIKMDLLMYLIGLVTMALGLATEVEYGLLLRASIF